MAGGSSSTNDVAKDKRRREAKEKARLAKSKLEEAKRQNDELKVKLEALAKSHKDGENKDEYERMKIDFETSGKTLEQIEEEARKAKKEEDDVMEGVEEGGAKDDALFVDPGSSTSGTTSHGEPVTVKPEPNDFGVRVEFIPGSQTGSGVPGHSFGSTDPPPIDLTDTGGERRPIDIEDPEDAGLFTPAHAREATGRTDDGEVVAWTERGNSTPVIIGFGPPNARKYERSSAFRSGIPFDKRNTPQYGPDHRPGDKKLGRKFLRKWDEFKGIQGEAYNCVLEELKPKEKGEKRQYPLTELLVKWEIDGKIFRAWEVRSSIKHLWPNPTMCDEYIYESAKHHAKQHQDWLDGQRKATSKSPSPGPQMDRLRPNGTPLPEVQIKQEGAGTTGASNPEKPPLSAMLEYKEEWCALEGIDPTQMTRQDKDNFLLTWNMMKAKL